MAYANRYELTQLALPASALSGVDEPAQEAALEAASDQVDSYLKSQYTLPLTAWEHDIKRAVCNIAAYDLMSMRGFNPEAGDDKNLRMRYEDTIRWLERIAKGDITPKVTDSSQAGADVTRSGGMFVTTGAQRGWAGSEHGEIDNFFRPGDFDD